MRRGRFRGTSVEGEGPLWLSFRSTRFKEETPMKRTVPFLVGSAVALALAASAFAQTPDAAKSEKSTPATTPAPDASATPATTPAPAEAAVKEAEPPKSNPAIDRVKERGMMASEKDRADVEKKLDVLEKEVETEATQS